MSDPGVYIIRNLVNNKCYVGQSWNVQSRLKKHKLDAHRGRQLISRSIKKYGWGSFQVEAILFPLLESEQDKLNAIEREYIIKYNSMHPYGYNLTEGGSNGKMSTISRGKISRSRKLGYANGRISRTAHNKGIPCSKEQRESISKTLKEKYASGEKLRKGTPRTAEQRTKQSELLKNKYASGELIPSQRGQVRIKEQREKISKTLKEKYASGEKSRYPSPEKSLKGLKWRNNVITRKREWYKPGILLCA